MRKWDGFGYLGVTQGHWKYFSSIWSSAYEFLLAICGNYIPIVHHFWYVPEVLVKIANFDFITCNWFLISDAIEI